MIIQFEDKTPCEFGHSWCVCEIRIESGAVHCFRNSADACIIAGKLAADDLPPLFNKIIAITQRPARQQNDAVDWYMLHVLRHPTRIRH